MLRAFEQWCRLAYIYPTFFPSLNFLSIFSSAEFESAKSAVETTLRETAEDRLDIHQPLIFTVIPSTARYSRWF